MLIQERIQIILKMHNLTPSAFADQIGVQRSALSHVLTGRNKPGLDFLEKILTHFPRVNAHWLITGITPSAGKDPNPKATETSKTLSNTTAPANSSERKLIKIVCFYSDGTFEPYEESNNLISR